MKNLLFCALLPLTCFGQGSGFIENFTLPNVVDGQAFSFKQYDSVSTVVVVFTSLYCPYAQLYDDRIRDLINDFQSERVRFLLINSNSPKSSPKESKQNMARIANEKQWGVPFLADHSQQVARMFGAEKSPEVFVLSRQKKSYKILYRGAIDDNPQVPHDVHHAYLRDFLSSSASNTSVHSVPPTGCIIKR